MYIKKLRLAMYSSITRDVAGFGFTFLPETTKIKKTEGIDGRKSKQTTTVNQTRKY